MGLGLADGFLDLAWGGMGPERGSNSSYSIGDHDDDDIYCDDSTSSLHSISITKPKQTNPYPLPLWVQIYFLCQGLIHAWGTSSLISDGSSLSQFLLDSSMQHSQSLLALPIHNTPTTVLKENTHEA